MKFHPKTCSVCHAYFTTMLMELEHQCVVEQVVSQDNSVVEQPNNVVEQQSGVVEQKKTRQERWKEKNKEKMKQYYRDYRRKQRNKSS